MKNKKYKKILATIGMVLGTAFAGLKIIAQKKKEQEAKDADLKKDLYEGAGGSVVYANETIYEKYIKRGLDVVMSFGGLVVLAPLYAGIALAIVIDDPGPVMFTQKRVGKDKTYFKLHKFRSMKMSTPHDMPTHLLENPDQYITRVGHVLRKYSLMNCRRSGIFLWEISLSLVQDRHSGIRKIWWQNETVMGQMISNRDLPAWHRSMAEMNWRYR